VYEKEREYNKGEANIDQLLDNKRERGFIGKQCINNNEQDREHHPVVQAMVNDQAIGYKKNV
jgi:hypothetical protein